jgi:hypothetical protein
MENCINKLVRAGSNIISIHCSSNFRPKQTEVLSCLAGVTALTSFTDFGLTPLGCTDQEVVIRVS